MEWAAEDQDKCGRTVRDEKASCCPPVKVGDDGDEVFWETEVAEDASDELGVARGGESSLEILVT